MPSKEIKETCHMEYHIPDEVLERTICTADFPCLKEGCEPECMILYKVVSGVLMTLCAGKPHCPHCQPIIGIEGLCCCPVRIYLFEKYGI